MASEAKLAVREMPLAEVDLRINYFHHSSDEHLRTLGVDRARLPTPEAWRSLYEEDYARPIEERESYSVVWELDGRIVGFSSTDHIVFGTEAFMHLHILEPTRRQKGLGAEFVRMSAETYFRVLELQRLYCEPNAFNTAPNRALQRAGFRYLFTHQAQPSPINFMQVTTRWVMDHPPLP
ncbi:MAG TPA: GNAT family protein [Acidimicrobiales bacterium]|nr:GNAT family protein [Acidimicrobiales bacterium]